MGNSRKTIKKRIFLSHIFIIVISVVLTSIVFNICLSLYIRYQTKEQLLSAAQIIQKSISTQAFSGSRMNAQVDEKEELKSLLQINRILKQTQTFLDIKYAVIGANERIVFPKNLESEDINILTNQIIPSLKRKNSFNSEPNKNRLINFDSQNKKYSALIHPLMSESNKGLGDLILYSDMKNSRQLTFSINIILFSILIVTSAIALIVSNFVSKRISKPISLLNNYARKIGERDYNPESIKYEDDEIGELAETMEVMAEKLSAYDNTMKTFLQNASHELRTPLMSIQGYAEGIKHGVIDDKDSAVEVIIDESKRLTSIVEDLLYLSKLDAMQETINIETVQAEELLRDCIERVNGIAVQKGIKLILSLQDKNLLLRVDEEKLSRALINILGNCLRYAKEEIKLNLEKQNKNIMITINDDGPGFDPKELQNIFNRFFKGKGGKHGLGLAITKSIIEKHNGIVSAENNVEGGACFRISLPE